MKLSDTFRPRLCRLSFVFIGLAISVFTWGLQYKLSLYYPKHSTYHQLPEAKLLSKNEQPAATKGLLMTSVKPPQDIVGGGLFTLLFLVWLLGLPSDLRLSLKLLEIGNLVVGGSTLSFSDRCALSARE